MSDAEAEAFESYYWLARAFVDEPGHTSWDHTVSVSDDVAEALGFLRAADTDDEHVREAEAILDELLADVPHREQTPRDRKRTRSELVEILDELDDNELAGLKVGMLPHRYMDELTGSDVAELMRMSPEGHL